MKIALVGYGAMGKVVEANVSADEQIIGIVAPETGVSFADLKEKPDVIIDYSHPALLNSVCEYAIANNVPVVVATTGHSAEQVEQIKDLATKVPVLYSGNYSLGVILLNRLVKQITPILKDSFDIEIIEKHHNKKVDAPSGTAKMLVNSVNADGDMNIVYGREGASKRQPYDVGVHAIRGGTIVGEHQVIYAGLDEVLTLTHQAHSKAIFAKGSLRGAQWLVKMPNGLYNMEDVLFN